ncbi:NAD(P)-dependent oxidoreductase [Streptoalloteichus hindustanus]|uniref:Alanine dehydrogenase n=1 Tax=Streptoalloteichus hindustanus TaxID=2017 RepID=A0A1M5MQI4_STRHI|nr:NAD(P)-dependent oxidoreductase [Streptoalloteichus hindustanus]SHG79670.1 alanine dehydrogenase [Streptoalloteichus hindustanus]
MHSSAAHVIGFPRESTPGDRRTLLTPTVACALREGGFEVVTEPGIGAGVFCGDADLAAQGVRFSDPEEVWNAPLVLRYKNTSAGDLACLHPGQSIGALFHAEGDRALLSALASSGVSAYSYEFVEEGGRFPLAAPGGEIAGIQAVLVGSQALQTVHNGRGVLLARVTGAAAPRVVVIGCGNVGSAAARTAAALGAEVTVLVRSETSANRYLPTVPRGVRVTVNTPESRHSALSGADLVIGAILVSTFDTPPMITEADLREMKQGAVIVDATCGYGDGYLPTAGPVQRPGDAPQVVQGVLHVKLDALPALVPVTTTEAYTANAAPYLVRLARVALLDAADPAIESARIAQEGRLVHPVCRQHAVFHGIPA